MKAIQVVLAGGVGGGEKGIIVQISDLTAYL
jgi:hypothetical protein